jgi:hypothetical protein
MLHITVGIFVVSLIVTGLIAFSMGVKSGRREAEKEFNKLESRQRREAARIERQETWSKRKATVTATLLPWRRQV